MKIKHLIIVGLILAVLTIGAVSATDDASDDLAVDEGIEEGEIASSIDDGGVIADPEDPPIDEREELDYDADVPEEVGPYYEKTITVKVYDQNATGNISVKIDNETVYNTEVAPYSEYWDDYYGDWIGTGGNYFDFSRMDLAYGLHDVVISYTGDENYLPFSQNYTLNKCFMKVNNPDGDLTLSFYIDIVSDAAGTVEVWIDDKFYNNFTAEYFIYEEGVFSLEGLDYGPHNYTIYYTGDDYALSEPLKGKFNTTYIFSVYTDDYDVLYFYNSLGFSISFPDDADGEIIISYNGKSITEKTKDQEGELFVTLSNFTLGKNNITFTFRDSKYPEKSVVETIYARPRFTVPSTVRYGNEEDSISIMLPSDAKGNLLVGIGEWIDDETEGDWNWTMIANATLKDGKANVLLSDYLGLGEYYISAIYDGDDYGQYIDYEDIFYRNEGTYVRIVPDVQLKEAIWVNATGEIKVVLPENASDVLRVKISSDDIDYENETFNAVANGTVTIPMPKLETGDYYAAVSYGEGYWDRFDFTVREESPAWDMNVTFPAELEDDNTVIISNIPENINGYFKLYIDGEIHDGAMYFDEDEYDLYYYGYGTHTWEIRFTDDSYYENTSKSGTFHRDWVFIDESYDADDHIYVYLEDMEGFIELKIDGNPRTELLDYGEASFSLEGLSIGNHTYEISYYDINNTRQLTKSGKFAIDYYMDVNVDADDSYPYVDEFELDIDVPEDATSQITVNVDGKIYTVTAVNGTATVVLKDLVMGENNITVTYAGDAKYPAKEIKTVLNMTGYGIIVRYTVEELFEYVSLTLPTNASGNLTLYNAVFEEYYDGESEEWIYHWKIDYDNPVAVKTVKLVNGTAKITVSEFTYGVYDLIAVYESDDYDYEVDEADIHFDITPEITIPEKIILGENATITIVMENTTGKILIYELIYDEHSEDATPELVDEMLSVNGTYQYVLTGLKLGDHDYSFEYDGPEGKLLNSHVSYTIEVTPKNVTIPETFSTDGSGEITFELPEGANGTITVTDGGKTIIDKAPYTSANKTFSITGLDAGIHEIAVTYSDDENGEITYFTSVNVPKRDAGADVKIPETITGDSFDVQLPKDATGGVLVTVDGNTTYIPLVNGTAKVNVSGLSEGTHAVTVKYYGDGNYSGFEKTANVTRVNVPKPDAGADVKIPETITGDSFDVQLPKDATGGVFVTVDGNTTYIPLVNGTAKVNVSGLSEGTHVVTVKYRGDGNYSGFEKTANVTRVNVPKPDAGADVKIPETITGDSFDVQLPKDATGGVFVTVDGNTTYIPLVNGTAKVNVSGLSEGTHTVTVKYLGDGNYSGFEKTANVTVPSKSVPAKIVAGNLIAYYNNAKYSVTVYGTDGNLAAGVTVVFKVNGKKVGTAKTNDKGVATITLKQTPKTYKITTEALGASETKKLSIKQVLKLKKVKVKKSAKKLVITATLKEGKKALKGIKITFKFNGKKYTAKTNKKGVAKITIKKKFLKKLKVGKKVKYQATYLKDTVKQTVKVKK